MKGFKDSSGKFHPITDYKGVRKSRDQSAKLEGVRIRKQRVSDPDTGFWTEEDWERMEKTGKLIKPVEKEFFRRKVEKILGNAYLPSIMTFRDPRGDKERESLITIESQIPFIDRNILNKIKSEQFLVLDRITKPFSGDPKDILLVLTIARVFADKQYADHQMELEVN